MAKKTLRRQAQTRRLCEVRGAGRGKFVTAQLSPTQSISYETDARTCGAAQSSSSALRMASVECPKRRSASVRFEGGESQTKRRWWPSAAWPPRLTHTGPWSVVWAGLAALVVRCAHPRTRICLAICVRLPLPWRLQLTLASCLGGTRAQRVPAVAATAQCRRRLRSRGAAAAPTRAQAITHAHARTPLEGAEQRREAALPACLRCATASQPRDSAIAFFTPRPHRRRTSFALPKEPVLGGHLAPCIGH